jgi:hypothetical protein
MTLQEKIQKAMDYPWVQFACRKTAWREKKHWLQPFEGDRVEWEGAAQSRETDYQSKNSANGRADEGTPDKTPTS